MRIEQSHWTAGGWARTLGEPLGGRATLVLMFGGRHELGGTERIEETRKEYPGAHVVGCSTAGEIRGTRVSDGAIVRTALRFERSGARTATVLVKDSAESAGAGETLAKALDKSGLVHVLVLSDGIRVNGSDLVRGLASGLPPNVTVTGGLSGDGTDFLKTVVLCDGPAEPGLVAAIGLYGDRLEVGYGSLGGWDPFGPERVVTRSRGNVLCELDGRSALELYKAYLGDHAKDLPASGLLFPLCVRSSPEDPGVVRTILSVDEAESSLTFAGDVPEGSYARLMKANFDRLVDGAVGAARNSLLPMGDRSPDFALLISCVGRKLILKQRVEEEVEGVREVLGERTVLAGFYSYGEISPFAPSARCELHNQTMTVTTLTEG